MLIYKTEILIVCNIKSVNIGFNYFHVYNIFISLHSKLKRDKKERA